MTAHPDKDEFIIFGGEYFNGQKTWVYNDLFFYNVVKKEWKQVKSPAGPAARSGHQMCATSKDGGQLWVINNQKKSLIRIVLQYLFISSYLVVNMLARPNYNSTITRTCGCLA